MKRNQFMVVSIVSAIASAVLMLLFCFALMNIADVKRMLLICIALGVPAMILLSISVTSFYARRT
ncbi:MAG: hypothetical protein AB7C89_04875 [Intestinibacillus sp.]